MVSFPQRIRFRDQTHKREGKQCGWCLKQKCKNKFYNCHQHLQNKLDEKFEEGAKMDKEYQNIREKVSYNEFQNVKTNYSLNEKD